MKRFAFYVSILTVLLFNVSAQAQTASELNEGFRVTKDNSTGVFTVGWWGKSGRTYFIQTSTDLVNWSYLPYVETGTDALQGIQFINTNNDPHRFWRLEYTDQSTGGASAAAADFDGDGLGNLAELNAGTNPFKADTDGDGFGDGLESYVGSSALDGANAPADVNQGYMSLIRSYDTEELTASESYWMDWWATGRDPGQEWWWVHNWNLPGDVDHEADKQASRPAITFKGFPFTSLLSDTGWQATGLMEWQQMPVPDYGPHLTDYYPVAGWQTPDSFDGASYKNESGSWNCQWWRYRLRLLYPLPHAYCEDFLAVVHRYTANSDYDAGSEVYPANQHWKHSDVREVVPMRLEIAAGARTGSWKFQSPTVAQGEFVVVQVVPVPITLRSNPNKLAPPNPEAMFTPAMVNEVSENEAHDKLVEGAGGLDQLGELSMGLGRGDALGFAYTGAVEVYATVPSVPDITWDWERLVTDRQWKIKLAYNSQLSRQEWRVSLDTVHSSDNEADGPGVFKDTTPSSSGRIYTGDGSAMNLAHFTSLMNGDYAYCKRQFTYRVRCSHPSSGNIIAAEQPVAQVMAMRRNAVPITIIHPAQLFGGFEAKGNTNRLRPLSMQLSESEVRALVGGNVPIVFE